MNALIYHLIGLVCSIQPNFFDKRLQMLHSCAEIDNDVTVVPCLTMLSLFLKFFFSRTIASQWQNLNCTGVVVLPTTSFTSQKWNAVYHAKKHVCTPHQRLVINLNG